METAEVQQKAAALSSQFRALSQDFRRIDPAGGYQRVIDLAGYGAKLCKKAYGACLLDLTRYKREVALLTEWRSSPQEDLQSWIRDLLLKEYGEIPDQPLDALNELVEPRLDERKMWPSMDSADMWAGTWRSILSHLSIDHPEGLPCNLFVDNRYLGSFGVQAPRNDKTEWPSLAQNYAMVADWLAERLQMETTDNRLQSKRQTHDAEPQHSDDFVSVDWFGTPYTFTPTQAACVKILWAHWEQRTPGVHQSTILAGVESASSRLSEVFDKGKHQAWGTMIVKVMENGKVKKGMFQLQGPSED